MKEPLSEIFTVRSAAQWLHVHPSTIYRLMKQGKLAGFKVGSDWRFTSAQLMAITAMAEAAPEEAGMLRRVVGL